ncbi:AAA-like domain protein [Thermincola ferriacetica]|uniref:AAA-like domain protein n=1 Tax=Thermincola ferriacetica TaxID=281456 RepID=A0A0L6VZV4_9FIRM|nr:DUF87 domain-containing protein [Thermincola ferriacetica]KNZ68678.1 AAA-like domain protein [Thermincola ferriacetica]
MLKRLLDRTSQARQPETDEFTANTPGLDNLINPPSITEYIDYLKVGSKYLRVFAVSVYPLQTYISWLDDVYMMGSVITAIHLQPQEPAMVKATLTRKITNKMSQYILEDNRGNILNLPELKKTVADYENLRELIQTGREKLFSIQILFGIYADTIDELNARSVALGDILARSDVRIISLDYRQYQGFRSLLGMCHSGITRPWQNGTTGNTISMLPITGSALNHPNGIWLGRNYFTGSMMFYDQFVGPPELMNPHIAVFGYSGAGKSTTLKVMLLRGAINGSRYVTIDVNGEYARMVPFTGGINIPIKPGQVSGINPFELSVEETETGQETANVADKIAEIKALITTMVELEGRISLTARESAILTDAIGALYAKRGIDSNPDSLYEPAPGVQGDEIKVGYVKKAMPTLTELAEELRNMGAEDMAIYLKPFLRTGEKGMFDCTSTVKLHDTSHINFDLSHIKDDTTRLYASFVIYTWVWHEFVLKLDKSIKKVIENDECWMFTKHPLAAGFLENYARRGRHYRFSLTVASQQVEEFLSSESGRAIINNCSTVILLRQNPSVVEMVCDHFRLSGGSGEFLNGCGPGEGIMLADGRLHAIKITPLDFEMKYIDTRPDKVAAEVRRHA